MVEFIIGINDLRHAIEELGANRDPEHHSDPTDILVSGGVATFSCLGTETEVTVNERKGGSVRLPLSLLENIGAILHTLKKPEVTIACQRGNIKVGSTSIKHPGIKLGIAPKKRPDLPVDLPAADTLALARILSPKALSEQGLSERVEAERAAYYKAIADAVAALQRFPVTEREVRSLVDKHIEAAVPRLRRSLKT